MAVVVYQSGQKVESTGWYEAVGVTRHFNTTAPAYIIKLTLGETFPDWKGRAICWRLYAVNVHDIPDNTKFDSKVGA